MRLFGSRQDITADTPLDGAIPADSKHRMSDLSPARVQSSIERALRILAARRAAGGRREHELQAVVQVCPAGEHYARWRKDRNRIMQRSSKRWGTHSWPERLAANEVAVVLLPYSAGRVGPALAAAKIASEPVFIHGHAETRPAVELLAIQLVRLWLHMTPDGGGSAPTSPLVTASLPPGQLSGRRRDGLGSARRSRPCYPSASAAVAAAPVAAEAGPEPAAAAVAVAAGAGPEAAVSA